MTFQSVFDNNGVGLTPGAGPAPGIHAGTASPDAIDLQNQAWWQSGAENLFKEWLKSRLVASTGEVVP